VATHDSRGIPCRYSKTKNMALSLTVIPKKYGTNSIHWLCLQRNDSATASFHKEESCFTIEFLTQTGSEYGFFS